jgi:hypothetical protein
MNKNAQTVSLTSSMNLQTHRGRPIKIQSTPDGKTETHPPPNAPLLIPAVTFQFLDHNKFHMAVTETNIPVSFMPVLW